jgi:hypothetical protein
MNRVWRFIFRFSNDNNTRSNTGIVIVLFAIVVYWLTCTGKAENMSVVYNNRGLWKASELCNSCADSWTVIWCRYIGWIAKWGTLAAIIYWFIARRDEVMRVAEGAWEKTVIDRGGVQDLPDQPPPGQTGATSPADGSALQRMRRRGFNWGQFLTYDFASNVFSDLLSSLILRRPAR